MCKYLQSYKRAQELTFCFSSDDSSDSSQQLSSSLSTGLRSDCKSTTDRKGFFKRMIKLGTRAHAMPLTQGNRSSTRLSSNTYLLPAITLNKSSLPISTSQISISSISTSMQNTALESVISAIHSGNFLQLSDTNLDLLIQALAGKDSKALETIRIKSAAISSTDARLLSKLIRSSDAANIKVLKLDHNAISQDAFKYLFEGLKVNLTITHFSIAGSGVNDKAVKNLAKVLANNTTLKELDLSNNRITAVGIGALCEVLTHNQSLTRLCLQSNDIKTAGARHLATLLKKNRVIRHLNIGANGLGGEGCIMIADAVRFNRTLRSLSLDLNEMGPQGASAMALAISSNEHLRYLYVPHNNIGDEGMAEICTSLKRNNSLIGLDLELNYNGMGQNVLSMKALAEALTVNKSLREVNLSYNLISTAAVQDLMAGVAANSTLESILFTNCCITTEGALAIANILPKAKGIQNLGLTSNLGIAVEAYWALATGLEKNRSMKGIRLDYNSDDKRVLYESIQQSLTRNFLWQQAVYQSTCQILTLSRIVLLGRPSERKQIGLKNGFSNSTSPLRSENILQMPHYQQHRQSSDQGYSIDSAFSKSLSPPSIPSQRQVLDYNAHSVMAHLGNMPYEIFEAICAFLDHDGNMSIAQIRATIRAGGDRSTLSTYHTKATMLEHILRSRYIPSVGQRYSIKNEEERV
ncbi:hypothetical protein BGZ49_005808 [Haplosporangium sp. Z 27]|nr:hypothetical protein BGZ49_005808 [Haplosporangium sp. Z 27]